jgi:hypothetical protein
MSSAGLIPSPPHIQHTTTRLTHRQAHTLLSAFLERTEIDAAYRPDSTLTERGPQALSSSGSQNLTLNHLKRVLQGIEGKKVGGVVKPLTEEDGTEPQLNLEDQASSASGKRGKRGLEVEGDQETSRSKRQKQEFQADDAATPTTDDWQDPTVHAQVDEDNDNVINGDNEEIENLDEEENAFEADRNPSATLKQPHNRKEEKELVSVTLEETGETVDPRTAANKKDRKRSKKQKQNGQQLQDFNDELIDEPIPVTATELSQKKRRDKGKKSKSEEAGDDEALPPSAQPTSSSQGPTAASLEAENEEATLQSLSKEERKKMKKLKQKDVKKDRQEQRMAKKKET